MSNILELVTEDGNFFYAYKNLSMKLRETVINSILEGKNKTLKVFGDFEVRFSELEGNKIFYQGDYYYIRSQDVKWIRIIEVN